MTILSAIRTICETYPVTPCIQIACAVICAFPTVLLLIAVLRSSIHPNCRILLCFWALAQLLVYATVCWLSVDYITYEEKYYKDSFEPSARVIFILQCYVPCWIICTCFELGISLERGFSILNPAKYYRSSAAYLPVCTYLAISMIFTYQVSSLLLSGSKTFSANVGAVLSNLMDAGSFAANIVVLIIARRKNNAEHKQLNERYQIRETYSIARAMLPVYCLSTALKVGIIIINWMYNTRSVPHTVCEVIYICFSVMSCGLTSSMFLLYHVRLRSKLGVIFRKSPKSNVVKPEDVTKQYFEMLSVTWQ